MMAAVYLLACLFVSLTGLRALLKMNRRTQHWRRAAFLLLTAGALTPLLVAAMEVLRAQGALSAAEAALMAFAAAPVSVCFYSLGTALLLVAGARGAA